MKYIDRLNQKTEAKDATANTTAAAQARELVTQEISKLRAIGHGLDAAYADALGSRPFNLAKVLSLTKEKANNVADLSIAEAVLTNEF